MAQLNITLDQGEILRLLSDSRGDAFRTLPEESPNAVLRAESEEQLRARPYERTGERTDCRNGTRERALTTRVGTLEPGVPRHRNAPLGTLVFENHERSEAALVTTMAEMVVAGVSTAKVGRVMEEICGRPFSKQSVSEACTELDAGVDKFRNRRLAGDYLFAMVDATYVKVRENHRIVSKALMVAIGLTAAGPREVIGVSLADAETEETWASFVRSLATRGLRGVRMLASDAHEGIVAALREVYPEAPWQRCQAHLTRNVVDGAPKRHGEGLRSELVEMLDCATIEHARARRDEIIADYRDIAADAVARLDSGFDDAMTVTGLPASMRRCTRTSNYLERLNKEARRRPRVIGIFPNATSALRLMGAFLMEENERWATKRKTYYAPACEEPRAKAPILARMAQSQREPRKAA